MKKPLILRLSENKLLATYTRAFFQCFTHLGAKKNTINGKFYHHRFAPF